MRLLENELCESEHYNPSDSESRMQPGLYREPCASTVSIVCRPENCHLPMPLAGLIYTCDTKTRKFILRRKFIRLPARKRRVNAARVRPGTSLFIFDYQQRWLWGTYEITTFPHHITIGGGYKEDDLLYQIYFRPCRLCKPLEEEVFRYAIKENYFTPQKFRFELSGNQVTSLLALFDLHTNYRRRTNQVTQRGVPEIRKFQAGHKFPNFDDEAVLSSAMRRSKHQKCFATHKHLLQNKAEFQLIADSKRTKSTRPTLQNKSTSLQAELLQCDLKLGRDESFLMDNAISCSQGSFEQGDGDSSTDTPLSLEDGEFVLPTNKATSSRIRQYQELQCNDTASVEEVDGDYGAEHQTRNFIENLERSHTSNSNLNIIHSSFSTAPDGVVRAAKESKNLAQHDGVKVIQTGETAVWIETKVQEILARTLGKRTRTPPSNYGQSTDGGRKSNRSVWLRLSDPRP